MAEVRHTEIFNCTPEQFFSILTDCEKYPEFLDDVDGCRIIKNEGEKKEVEFQITVIKPVKYVNEHFESKDPFELSFKFVRGDVFKSMHGHWRLQAEGDKTKAEYFIEANLGLFVPGAMAKTVINANLPKMMQGYHNRVAQLFG